MEADDLEQKKRELEVQKLAADVVAARHHRWAEWFKAGGAIAAMVFASYAAVTTYRVTQLEARVALSEKKEADKERAEAVAAKNAAVSAKNDAERELAALLAQVRMTRVELAALEARSSTPALAVSLKTLGGDLENASQTAERVLPYVLIVPALSAQNDSAIALADIFRREGLGSGVNAPLRKPENGPSVVEVHYFKPAEREEAERVLKLLAKTGVTGRVVPRFTRNMPRERYYELRLPIGFEMRGAA